MVTIPKNQFEDFVAGNVPDCVGIFETVVNQPITEIPLSELILLFKKFFSVSQIVNNIEINVDPGQEYVKIQHDYRDEKTISKIIQYFSDLFEATGHTFDVKKSSSFIIFKHHQAADPK